MRSTIGSLTIPLYFVPSHRMSRRPSGHWMTFSTTLAKPAPRLPRACITSGRAARLLEEDRILATEILKNDAEPGVNLLFYGAPSLEKRRLLQDVIGKSGRQAFRVRRFDSPQRGVLPSLTFAAFSLLAARKDPAVLIIERPADVLQTHPSQMLRALFGVEISAEDALPFDENLLATNPVPAI